MSSVKVTHVYAVEAGDTHLAAFDLPVEHGRDRAELPNVPTTTMTITEMMVRRPTRGLHAESRRQLLVILRGAFEITTTAGDRGRFQAGECVLVDDVGAKGHTFADVGEDPLITVQIGIAEDWDVPR